MTYPSPFRRLSVGFPWAVCGLFVTASWQSIACPWLYLECFRSAHGLTCGLRGLLAGYPWPACPWGVHEVSVGCPQAIRELSIVCPWAVHGLPVDRPRSVHGLSMGCPWSSRGLPVVFWWAARGFLVGYSWAVHEMPVGCPWAVFDLFMDYPWAVRGLSIGCP